MRVWLLLASMLLAGCSTAPIDVTEPTPPDLDETLRFVLGDVTQVAPNPNSQSEAAVTVSPDGQTILTCFHGFFTSLSPGYASTDGGKTWQAMEFPEAGIGGDCETAMLDDGSWVFLASTVAGATVLVSQDEGASWSFNALSAIPINGLADRPWIHGVGNEIWLAYMPLNFQPGTIGFTKSTDHGETWTTPILIGIPGPDTYAVRHGHMVDHDGSVHIPMVRYETTGTEGRQVQVATTSDGGATWDIEVIYDGPTIIGDWPSMAITQSGQQLVVATGSGPSDSDLFGIHRQADGWSEPFVLYEGNVSTHWPFADGGHGDNATFVTTGGFGSDSELTLGRIDLGTMEVQTWRPAHGVSVEFASVDHDAMGQAYTVWTATEAQYFVKGSLTGP